MQEKLNGLIARQGDRVYRMAFSICPNEADDIWQEVFLQWLRKQPAFPDEARERAWLLKVTANLCRSRLRSPWYKRREELPETIPASDAAGRPCGSLSTACQRICGRRSICIITRATAQRSARSCWGSRKAPCGCGSTVPVPC